MRINKNASAIAEVLSAAGDCTTDPVWRAAFARMRELLATKPATGFRLGRGTEEDKRGPSRTRSAGPPD